MEQQQDTNRHEALLKEYESLRKEIADRQTLRFTILGFTVATIGTILGLTADRTLQIGSELDRFTLALVSFALGALITAQNLTIHQSQRIANIAAYIRVFIESQVDGIEWETRLKHQKDRDHPRPQWVGTSRSLAGYYVFLTLAASTMAFIAGLHRFPLALALVSLLSLGSLASSLDLFFHLSRGWKLNWD
jgi:hypothetical protein